MRIAVLLTCYNRKPKTINIIGFLLGQIKSNELDIYLCDDNSTDGTSEYIINNYPSVNVIKGTGSLFWNRGMLLAWKCAVRSYNYDVYIWLNDDVELNRNFLDILIDCYYLTDKKAIICGSLCSSSGNFTYGGRDCSFKPIIPNGELQELYYLNGNCVLIPNYVINRIGLLDGKFTHHLGDYDYGLRAIENNIKVYTTPCYIGYCEQNNKIGDRSRKSGVNIFSRFKILYSPLGYNPITRFTYQKRHFGIARALMGFIQIHVNNVLPDKIYVWKKKIFSSK